MPTYTYKREDGTTFEVVQAITDEKLSVCPDTGQRVKRIIKSPMLIQKKGSGWYKSGYIK